MIKNYIKIAWRNLLRNKENTFINVIGLSLGMAVVMLISLWIYDELSFNKNFKSYNSIVRVMQHQTVNGNVLTQEYMPIPLADKLRQNFSEDFKYVVLSTFPDEHIISCGDKKLRQIGNYMQADAPDLFSLNMLKGSRSGLKDLTSIMLSASLAKAMFGNHDPLNQLIKIDNQYVVKVSGVYADMPQNSNFSDVAFIAPWDLYMTTEKWLKRASTAWNNNTWQMFAQLKPNVNADKVSTAIKYVKLQQVIAQGDKMAQSFMPLLFLKPMREWHLYSEYKNGVNTGGEIEFVWMFGIIGSFVLLLACINFMNLSTARSEQRAKEVGIRKTLGSDRKQLIAQFFSESILIALFSFIISLIVVQLALPWFNQVAQKDIVIPLGNPLFWLVSISFSLFTGILAGSYPALYLSSFQPVKVLKGTFRVGRLAALPRKILVVTQFTVSVILIIGTVIIFKQIQYTKNRAVGYNRTGLIQIRVKTNNIHDHFTAVNNDLQNAGAIAAMAESDSPLTEVGSNESGLTWNGKPPGLQDDFGMIPVSYDFGKTAGWQVIAGRDFSRAFADSLSIIVNQSAAKFMNFKDPIGEIVKWDGRDVKIIGVIKDMVMSSPYDPVKPSIFSLINYAGYAGNDIDIRVNPQISMHEALGKIEAVFKQYDPDSPFTYNFTDTEYAKKFQNEERIGTLSSFFTILAIFISCLGLFGMASFMAEQRTIEIGVRKVLGASVLNLWGLMSKDFVVLVSVSILIAMPVAYYFMQGWVKNYKYHTDLSWWIFALTAIGSIIITLLTVSYQSIKAALSNPISSLRSE